MWISATKPADLADELEEAKEKIEDLEETNEEQAEEITELKGQLKDRPESVDPIRSALLNIDRINRDGGNPFALELAHNTLERAIYAPIYGRK